MSKRGRFGKTAQRATVDGSFAIGDVYEYWAGGPVFEITDIDGNSVFLEGDDDMFPIWAESGELLDELIDNGVIDFKFGRRASKRTAAYSWVDTGGYHPAATCDLDGGLIGIVDWNGGFDFEWRIERNGEVMICGESDSISKAMRECTQGVKDVCAAFNTGAVSKKSRMKGRIMRKRAGWVDPYPYAGPIKYESSEMFDEDYAKIRSLNNRQYQLAIDIDGETYVDYFNSISECKAFFDQWMKDMGFGYMLASRSRIR